MTVVAVVVAVGVAADIVVTAADTASAAEYSAASAVTAEHQTEPFAARRKVYTNLFASCTE